MRQAMLLILCVGMIASVLGDDISKVQKDRIDKILYTREANIQKLKRDINCYNLLNGIHLNANQMRTILNCARQARELQERYFGKRVPRNLSGLERELNILLKMKWLAHNGKDVPPWMEKMYYDESERRPKNNKPVRHIQYQQELKLLENQVHAVLLPAQKQVLDDYKPCVVPPKNLKDPVRIGQVANNDIWVDILTQLRENRRMNSYREENLFEKGLNRYEQHQGKLSPEERRTIIEQWKKVIQQARSLSDVDFEVRKEELASQLQLPDKKDELHKAIAKQLEGKNLPGKAAQFLLNPDMIPILEARLQLLAQPRQSKRTDLSKIEKAKTCEDGKCAVED